MSRKGTRDVEEYYYTQKITARILNGTIKGKRFLFLMNIHRLRFQNPEISQRRHGPFKRFKGKSREIHTFHKA
mgnify:CR=1 FL=1